MRVIAVGTERVILQRLAGQQLVRREEHDEIEEGSSIPKLQDINQARARRGK